MARRWIKYHNIQTLYFLHTDSNQVDAMFVKTFLQTFLVLIAVAGSYGSEGGLRDRDLGNCANVLCALVVCGPDEVSVRAGGCCTQCKPKGNLCDGTQCFVSPVCSEDQVLVVTPKDCCGTCKGNPNPKIDCSLVKCWFPEGCTPGITPPGQCCPVCMPPP